MADGASRFSELLGAALADNLDDAGWDELMALLAEDPDRRAAFLALDRVALALAARPPRPVRRPAWLAPALLLAATALAWLVWPEPEPGLRGDPGRVRVTVVAYDAAVDPPRRVLPGEPVPPGAQIKPGAVCPAACAVTWAWVTDNNVARASAEPTSAAPGELVFGPVTALVEDTTLVAVATTPGSAAPSDTMLREEARDDGPQRIALRVGGGAP
jgi:hypothetical protein